LPIAVIIRKVTHVMPPPSKGDERSSRGYVRNLLEAPQAGRMVLCRIPDGLNGPGAFRLSRKMDLHIAKTPMTGNDMKRYSVSLPK